MTVRHILVVDDEPMVALFMARALKLANRNYCVSIAHSGEEALETFQRTPVDLLVTDLVMPGIDGLELIRQAQVVSPRTRAILITAYGDEQIKAEARRLGVCRYLIKPFYIEELVQAVQEALLLSNAE
jgi:DNA-binding response OmpR family regulator